MKVTKASLIVTVFNEQDTITGFLKSAVNQTVLPEEIVVVDGGSKDNTIKKIHEFITPKEVSIKILSKKGNRSVGRNEAVKSSKNEIILCSDAGCILERNWVDEITLPFKDRSVDVVAGYYKGIAKSYFQKCLLPFVLVMKDKIDINNFLPATRSMAFKKNIWKKIGGFDENLSHNEDYNFALKLKNKAKIVFAQDAVVKWIPRKNVSESFFMFLRFAYGDGESNLIRGKVLLIYARYAFFVYLVILTFLEKSFFLLSLVFLLPLLYVIWSIKKNYKYV